MQNAMDSKSKGRIGKAEFMDEGGDQTTPKYNPPKRSLFTFDFGSSRSSKAKKIKIESIPFQVEAEEEVKVAVMPHRERKVKKSKSKPKSKSSTFRKLSKLVTGQTGTRSRTLKNIDTNAQIKIQPKPEPEPDVVDFDMSEDMMDMPTILVSNVPNSPPVSVKPEIDKKKKNPSHFLKRLENASSPSHLQSSSSCSVKAKSSMSKPTPAVMEKTPKLTLSRCDGPIPRHSVSLASSSEFVEIIIDSNVDDFNSLTNSKVTGNKVTINSKHMANCASVMEPTDVEFRDMYPGVGNSTVDKSKNVTTGYMEIAPRSLKPLEMTAQSRMIYWVLKGQITARSTAHMTTENGNILFGKSLASGSCLLVPPLTPYTLENRSSQTSALIGYVLLNP